MGWDKQPQLGTSAETTFEQGPDPILQLAITPSSSMIFDAPSESSSENLPIKNALLNIIELWWELSMQATVSGERIRDLQSSLSSDDDVTGPRDWTGYITKGERIGGGGFGDVYLGNWVNIPEDGMGLKEKTPKVVVKEMRTSMKQAVDKKQAKVCLSESNNARA
jgi:hypothetical protein